MIRNVEKTPPVSRRGYLAVDAEKASIFANLHLDSHRLFQRLEHRHDAADQSAHRGQFGGAEVDAGIDTQTVREIASQMAGCFWQ